MYGEICPELQEEEEKRDTEILKCHYKGLIICLVVMLESYGTYAHKQILCCLLYFSLLIYLVKIQSDYSIWLLYDESLARPFWILWKYNPMDRLWLFSIMDLWQETLWKADYSGKLWGVSVFILGERLKAILTAFRVII